ncbi:RNA_polymerase Rpc34 subunit [Hexamita inflata]|uniref:RNA_polymerase Rpc34 subunit n=1 Tax=Hexamita inflata TaxID=28002 RepID=A0ABP1H1T8_9EUKA
MNNEHLNKVLVENYSKLEKQEAKKLYQFIVQSKSKGVSQQAADELMQKYGITNTQTNALLKNLMARQFIQMVSNQQKKMYYMTELAPKALNLPPWFTNGHFDDQYATNLMNLVKQTIQVARQVVVNLDYITNVVRNNPQLTSKLNEDDVKTLVNALVADGSVIEFESLQHNCKCYLVPQQQGVFGPFFQGGYYKTVPCGKCQLIGLCESGSGIESKTCVYIQQWLKGE